MFDLDHKRQGVGKRVTWRWPAPGKPVLEPFEVTIHDTDASPINEAQESLEAVVFEGNYASARERVFSLWRAIKGEVAEKDGIPWGTAIECGQVYREGSYSPNEGIVLVQPVKIRYNVPSQSAVTVTVEAVDPMVGTIIT